MRVIAGTAGGRHLVAPHGRTTRPTSDRVKEALFSILASLDCLADALILDLFAGSGALGIEALSRGARHAVFVEKDRTALAALAKNLAATGFSARSTVLAVDVELALKRLQQNESCFNVVLLDPPYQSDLYTRTIAFAGTYLMTPDGLLVAETAKRVALPEKIVPCARIDYRVYGDTVLEFYALESRHAP